MKIISFRKIKIQNLRYKQKLNFFQYSMDPGTGHCSEETVGSLRQRLNVMREIVKVH
jgi:hypothetical protein